MKAAQYLGARRIAYNEIPDPVPGPGEVAVKVAYCGICGTDLHIFHGSMDSRVHPPQAVGHEVSGTVAAVVHALGLGTPFSEIALSDPLGQALEAETLPKRIRTPKKSAKPLTAGL